MRGGRLEIGHLREGWFTPDGKRLGEKDQRQLVAKAGVALIVVDRVVYGRGRHRKACDR